MKAILETGLWVPSGANLQLWYFAAIRSPEQMKMLTNILLAAADRGIGGCWQTAPVETEVDTLLRETFSLGKVPLVSLLTLGHPAKESKAPPRKNSRYIIL